jgi:hypothetical protein
VWVLVKLSAWPDNHFLEAYAEGIERLESGNFSIGKNGDRARSRDYQSYGVLQPPLDGGCISTLSREQASIHNELGIYFEARPIKVELEMSNQ